MNDFMKYIGFKFFNDRWKLWEKYP
jgi:hypothetical protein